MITGREYETVLSIPLVVKNMKPGKMMVNDVPKEVKVLMKGSGRSLIALTTFKYAQLELDLSTISSFFDFPLSVKQIKLTSSLNVDPIDIISPDTVGITLDEWAEKELPILPNVKIQVKPGYALVGEVRTTPGEVTVRGPKSIIDELRYLPTVEKEYTDLKRNVKESIEMVIPHAKIQLPEEDIVLHAKIERLMEKQFKNINVTVNNPPRRMGIHLDPDKIKVKVSGAVSIIKNLDSGEVHAYIDFPRRWNDDITGFVPGVTLPEGIELVDIEPDTIFMTLVESR